MHAVHWASAGTPLQKSSVFMPLSPAVQISAHPPAAKGTSHAHMKHGSTVIPLDVALSALAKLPPLPLVTALVAAPLLLTLFALFAALLATSWAVAVGAPPLPAAVGVPSTTTSPPHACAAASVATARMLDLGSRIARA